MNTLSLIMVGTIALSLGIFYPMMSLAQFEEQTGEQSQDQIEVPLNFSLNVPGDGEDQNATEGGKDVTVTLNIESTEGGSATQVPLTAMLSNDTQIQDLEVCATFQGGNEMCQSLEEVVNAQEEDQTSGEPTDGNGEPTDGNGEPTDGNGGSTDGNGGSTDGNGDNEDN
jgi:hypothetical protein